jgi:hypothetical protein
MPFALFFIMKAPAGRSRIVSNLIKLNRRDRDLQSLINFRKKPTTATRTSASRFTFTITFEYSGCSPAALDV